MVLVCVADLVVHCSTIVETNRFVSTSNSLSFKIRHNTTCSTQNVIYLITCKKCRKQYIGQTRQQVSKRMNSHKFDIRNFDGSTFATNVAIHFNSDNHCLNDFSSLPIDIVQNDMERLLRETYWIHVMNTVSPNGLNSDVLYNV